MNLFQLNYKKSIFLFECKNVEFFKMLKLSLLTYDNLIIEIIEIKEKCR
jgi:hypothetical protein